MVPQRRGIKIKVARHDDMVPSGVSNESDNFPSLPDPMCGVLVFRRVFGVRCDELMGGGGLGVGGGRPGWLCKMEVSCAR